MDQNVMHSTYQSAITLKDTVKLSVIKSREKKEGTMSLGNLAFSTFALSWNEGSFQSKYNFLKKCKKYSWLI